MLAAAIFCASVLSVATYSFAVPVGGVASRPVETQQTQSAPAGHSGPMPTTQADTFVNNPPPSSGVQARQGVRCYNHQRRSGFTPCESAANCHMGYDVVGALCGN
jgi:hypothetical protein